MGSGNSAPVPSGVTASPSLTSIIQRDDVSDATDGDTPAIQFEKEYLATVNALQDRLDVLERLVLVQHRSEEVLQQKIEVIKKLRDMAESLEIIRDPQNNGANVTGRVAPEVPAGEDALGVLETVYHLPEELERARLLQARTDVLQERKDIIQKLRDIATNLEKTHKDVLIADRVGTRVGIGAGCLVIGGIVAAPFTAGLSLSLTAMGAATGVAGGLTSVGANITGFVMEKKMVASLEEELKTHLKHVEQLSSSDSTYLSRALRMRPTLQTLGNLSQGGWKRMVATLQKFITLALNGNHAEIHRTLNHRIDPEIKRLIQMLPLPTNPESLQLLAQICTLIVDNICSIKNAIKAFLNYFKRPELAKLAMIYTNTAAVMRTTTTTTTAAEITSTFRGTPMAMTRTARVAASALTAAFIVVDVIHMVRICRETGETPTVQELRKMANDLEEEITVPLDDITREKELHKMTNGFQKESVLEVDANKKTMEKDGPCFWASDVRDKIGVPSKDKGRIEETDEEQFFDCREN